MNKTTATLPLLALCLCAGLALGTPIKALANSTNEQTLEKVVVTAGRVEEKSTKVTQSVTVISNEEIRKNQHQDIGGLLRQHGVQVDSYNPSGSLSKISIRGLSTAITGDDLRGQVLILVNGRRSGTGNISLIPLVNIERIEIIRGAAAVQYGTSAMGGAVNIITKRGKEQTSAMFEMGAGSFETFRSQGEIAGYFKGFDYSLGLSLLNSDDYKTGSGKTYHNTGLEKKTSYSANLGYNFLDEHRIGISALGVDADEMGSPNDIRDNNHSAYSDRYNYSFDGIYDGGLKEYGLSWQGRYFIGRDNYLTDDPLGIPSFSYYKSKTDFQGAQGQLSLSKSFITLTGGLDWTKYDLWNSANDKSDYKNTGAFLLAKLSFADELIIISGGLRYDDYKLETPGKNDDFNNTTPSVGIAINPLNWLSLRSNYSESYLIPEAQQMLGFKNNWGGDYIGNPDLDPEKGKGWDIGFDVHYQTFNFAATYFQTDYKDKIDTRDVVGSSSKQYYNIKGKSKLHGLEAQTSFDIGNLFDWKFSLRPYANITHMLKYEDDKGKDIKNVSKTDFAYGLGFNHPYWGLDVDLRFVYYGKQKIDNFDPISYSSTPDTIGGRTTADLYITKSFFESEDLGTFSVKAEFRNIFDKDYYLIKEYPMPGRSFWLGLRYDY